VRHPADRCLLRDVDDVSSREPLSRSGLARSERAMDWTASFLRPHIGEPQSCSGEKHGPARDVKHRVCGRRESA
jgi:hypothetical protein